MRYSEKFYPEWGYLDPAPTFIRTVGVVFAATAVGVIAGDETASFSPIHFAPSASARPMV
jgi:hypothetical protein